MQRVVVPLCMRLGPDASRAARAGRHAAWVRRLSLACLLAAAAVLCAGWIALGAANRTRPHPARAVHRLAIHHIAVQLPPLPTRRGRVVEPVAGGAVPVPASTPRPVATAPPDTGLTDSTPAPTGPASPALPVQHPASGGSASVDRALALPNGVAVPPLEAPEAVKQIIEAGNAIARTPYLWGGGHGRWLDKGYDCSGSVSFVLAAAGLLGGPLDSGHLMSWGARGKGRWVTIYANSGHVFLEVAGIRFDTGAQRVTGSRWASYGRPTAGFVARHPPGL
jgi:cell wall-associated NlpC family hydrolase